MFLCVCGPAHPEQTHINMQRLATIWAEDYGHGWASTGTCIVRLRGLYDAEICPTFEWSIAFCSLWTSL